MRFLFTADWQADFENLDLCERAAEDVVTICKEKRLQGFCIAGDLKRQYNPVDVRVTKFWMRFIKRATDNFKLQVIVVLGNHDRVGMYADAENWLPILREAGATVVFGGPKRVRVGSGAIYCLPFSSSIEETRKWAADLAAQRKQVTEQHSILVFHNDIRGCFYNRLKQVSTSKLTVDDLKPKYYEYSFGGHVHLQQHLGQNVYYTGSPFTSDWGEANQKKVFYVVEGGTFYTVPSSIPGWYDPSWPQFPHEKKDWKGTRVRIHVPIGAGQNYAAMLEKARLDAERRYGGASIYTVPEFEESTAGKATVKLTDPDTNKIKAYVEQTLPDDLERHRSAIVSYLGYKLNKVSAGLGLRTGGRIEFLSAKARRFLSYKDLEVDYTKAGLFLIVARNRDWLNRSNGGGKTNFLSPVPVALFGKTFKEQKHDSWAMNGSKKKAWVSLRFRNQKGQIIKVHRGRRPGILQLFVDGKDRSSGMQSTSQAGTQGLVEKLSGFTWQTLANAVYIDQQQVNSFLTGTASEQKKILERFQNLERFTKALEEIMKDVHKQETAIDEAVSEQEICSAEIRGLKSVLAEETKPVEVEACQHKLNLAKKAFDLINNQWDSTRPVLQQKRERLDQILSELEKTRIKFREEKNDLTVRQKVLLDKIGTAENLVGKTTCPTCLQEVDAKHLEEHLSGWRRKQKVLQKKFDRLQSAVTKVVNEINDVMKRSVDVQFVESDYRDQIGSAKGRVMACETQLATAKYWWNTEKEKRAKLKKKIRNIRANLKFWVRQVDILSEEKGMLEYCARAFSRNGVPAFLNAQICPQLNAAAEHYSEVFTDKEIQVRFLMKESEFEVEVVNAHGGQGIQDQSTGEKKIAAIIACFALRSIAPPCNLLVLDEPGDGLDAVNAKAFAQGLRRMKDQLGTVMLTSHNPVIVGELSGESCIIVEKRGGVSYVA